jgi:sortase A
MTLTVPALGVYDAPVFDSDSPQALDRGVAHVPETSMPWDPGAQRNVYLAAHRLGYEGTGSRLLFYQLHSLGRGDEVVLEGRGVTYRYRVTEKLVVEPTDSWVMGQVRGRDMVSLQTCTPIPTFEKRLVVRADRV